ALRAAAAAPPPAHASCPDAVARRAVEMALRIGEGLAVDRLLLLDDDGVEERGDVLAARAEQAGIPTTRLALSDPLPALERGTRTALVIFASARAWKGSSGISAACAAQVAAVRAQVEAASLRTVWLTPRMIALDGIHVPGTGPQVEAALAERLLPTVRRTP
ncbi:MAG: hypothetical protein O2894_12695, partial [Planctomycetota bacterium]|nr:hypothetical protein [Planctomycetota bacterium]